MPYIDPNGSLALHRGETLRVDDEPTDAHNYAVCVAETPPLPQPLDHVSKLDARKPQPLVILMMQRGDVGWRWAYPCKMLKSELAILCLDKLSVGKWYGLCIDPPATDGQFYLAC